MQTFLEKIIVVLESLQERSLNERRALFFASFLVVGTLVFAFWSSHMYRQFGVAFSGGYGQETELAKNRDNNEEGLLSPFDAVYENAQLIRTEAGNLFSAIYDRVKEVAGLVPAPPREEAGKEPPVRLGEIVTEKPVPIAVKTQDQPSVEIPVKKESATAVPIKPVIAEPEAPVTEPAKAELAAGKTPLPEEPGKDTRAIDAKKEKRSRIASILATNFASIKQAFADFYEYLTQ